MVGPTRRASLGTAVRAIASSDVTGDRFAAADVEGQRVLFTRRPDGSVVAFESSCPHLRQPLTFGTCEDGAIVCPHHRYGYDADTGENVFPGRRSDLELQLYRTDERDGWVWIELPAAE